jgi:hypothetical protein
MITRGVIVVICEATLLSAQVQIESAKGSLPHAAGKPDTSNIECVERIQVPTYPPLARQARLSGSVVATVTLAADGGVEQVTTSARVQANQAARGILAKPVEDALRRSQFAEGCGKRSVVFVFEFLITGDSSDRQQQEVSYGYPNRFWITARPWPMSIYVTDPK